MDDSRKMMRVLGLVLALSTPISAIISFALVAIVIGEDRLEGANGDTTVLGYAVMAAPLVVGLAMAAWAHIGLPVPDRQSVALSVGLFGLLCIVIGGWSVGTADGDASIGGALLIFFGLACAVVGLGLFVSGRTRD